MPSAGREVLPFDGSAVVHDEFLDASEAADAFTRVMAEVPWEDHEVVVFGRVHREPRRSAWMSRDGVPYTYAGREREGRAFTPLVAELAERCGIVAAEGFNAVLANLYRDGRDGMGWHADDEALHGPDPTIGSLSLGATRRFAFRHRHSRETIRLDLLPGSLLVMSGATQRHWVHSVPKTSRQVGSRINLTFRRVVRATTR